MRPLFPQWIRDDIQIVATTLSMDDQVPPAVIDKLAQTGKFRQIKPLMFDVA